MSRATARFALFWLLALTTGCGSDDARQLINRVDIASQQVQSVAISGAEQTISTGADLQLQLLANNANGGSIAVTQLSQWTSSDPNIATVSQSGLLLGVTDGTVDVGAEYGPFSDSVSVRISSAPLERITVQAESPQFNVCTSQQLMADGFYLNEAQSRPLSNEVNWQVTGGQALASFSDALDASGQRVDPQGFLRTFGVGDIQVSASLNEVAGSLSLETLPTLADGGISIDQLPETVTVGTPLALRALANFSDGAQNVDITDNASWSLTVNEGTAQFATVGDSLPNKGVVNATQAGGGTLSVSCGGISVSQAIRAELPPTVDEVVITPDVSGGIHTVNVNSSTVALRGIVRFTNGDDTLDVTEQAEWTSTGDVRALELSDRSGSRGVVTINGVGEIVVTMEYQRDGFVYRPQLTVRAQVF